MGWFEELDNELTCCGSLCDMTYAETLETPISNASLDE